MRSTVFQFLRFCMVGLANTSLSLITIYVLMYGLGIGPFVANAIGYAVGLCFSFFANGRWTFRTTFTRKVAFRFAVAFAVSYIVNLAVLYMMLTLEGVPPMLAQVAAMGGYTILFFILSKFFVFVNNGSPEPEKVQ